MKRQSKRRLASAAMLSLLALLSVSLTTAARAADLPMTLSLEWLDGAYLPLQNGKPLISFEPQDRPRLELGGVWRKQRVDVSHEFSLSPRDESWQTLAVIESDGAIFPDFDDSGWATHALPGVENAMPATPDDPAGPEIYEGGVYYRRHFTAPAAWNGQVVRLACLAADYVADVWVNGAWVGWHEGGYAPFAFDVSAELNYGEDNVVVFRVDAMPWRIRFDIIPNWFATDWMHYVGVVQDVYLEAAPPTHVVRADALPQNVRGDVDVAVVVENDGTETRPLTARLRVYELDAANPDYLTDPVTANLLGDEAPVSGPTSRTFAPPAGRHGRLDFALTVENPRLWSPAEPNLYALVVELRDGDTPVDSFATQFGVRTVEVGDSAKVLLNRRPAYFTGMARHEDWPDSGRTATVEQIARDLQIIRDTNVWFLRSAHYPNHPATYLLTDRLGFAVWQEIPAWWINMFTIPVLLERGLAMQMWREMIWNSRNRPSVLFWSLCNEPMWYLAFNLREYVQALHADVDENYPDGRLVTQSLAADGAALTAPAQQDVDVAGWTMYFGVFYGEDVAAESLDFLQRQHDRFPDQPLLACEYGYWSGDGDPEAARQVEIANLTLDAFEQLAAVDANGQTTDGPLCAATWWCQFNWYRVSEEGHTQTMGLMHMDRETDKPVRQTVANRYQPYFAMGGLGPSVDPPDDDDNDNDDNDDSSPPETDDDDQAAAGDDDDNDAGGCGC